MCVSREVMKTNYHSHVTANTASTNGGGIYNFSGSVSVQMSPVEGNKPNDCFNVPGC